MSSIEVCLRDDCAVDFEELRSRLANLTTLADYASDKTLRKAVQSIVHEGGGADETSQERQFYLYQLEDEPPIEEVDDTDNGEIAMFSSLSLPNKSLHGLWESLIYEEQLKADMLHYVSAATLFARNGVSQHIINCNRVVLLHGPAGTGKTSLCRALAQKLAIRRVFEQTRLIEINAHSLFSKWFSESGKLVTKLFAQLREMTDDEACLLVVLIDEVESLTAARSAAMSGVEPSDAIRVVNALLTQLDRLRTCPNVLLLTTSNLSAAVDAAFVDRADLKLYIGPPSLSARYAVLASCIDELARVGLISPRGALLNAASLQQLTSDQHDDDGDDDDAATAATLPPPPNTDEGVASLSMQLHAVCKLADGFSGRALRKLPLLTVALRLHGVASCSLAVFLAALHETVMRVRRDTSLLGTE